MRSKSILVFAIVILVLADLQAPATAYINFNDGGEHVIDYYINDAVWVDAVTPGAGTKVELVSGGKIEEWLAAGEDSWVIVSDGEIGGNLGAFGNSRVSVSGGSIGWFLTADDTGQVSLSGGSIGGALMVEDYGQATVSAGLIERDIRADDNSRITMSGGVIGGDIFAGYSAFSHRSLITFDGTDFAINAESVGYGDLASSYAVPGLDPWGESCLTGIVTGILANGDMLNNNFYIYDKADITFVPEPSTLFLLGFGAILLRKRRT